MFYYKATHKYKLIDHIEKKDIGIYSSLENAKKAIKELELKDGFIDTKNGFFVKKFFSFVKPKLLDKTFWVDGFDTYVWVENITKKIICDVSYSIMEHFSFLVKDYGFKFDKVELGDMKDENGKLWFYGPFNCYSFYNENICINFMNLVQRQDWYITITKEFSNNQTYISKGQQIDSKYYYNWELLASVIKNDIEVNNEVFGNSI
ncbi:Uncharacterised protein [Acholeplasma oculi]|uniref:Uncharacterized protein n=1 Tax=Acholeplasma oculi TaxID=35623 RepID=A0A061A9U1_9MOLU|nr:hypothetical protein [Acholeplasma oculi]CDR30638.1 hypothetical protein Aocu_05650 [Acholeplasma oculi]SKC45928.1 hypothetical protein SAMN02745122_1184 [Acholeplasma oculi]SUT89384.1 Uncharacterised protein [Acholeplasma oculi]